MNEMLNRLSRVVIGRAIEVHKELGPGLLESAYEECLAHEFKLVALKFERQKPIALKYKTGEGHGGENFTTEAQRTQREKRT
jgi:GxxExxY protein